MALIVKPAKLDLAIRAGADFALNLVWRDKETGDGVDTAEATIDAQIRPHVDSTTLTLDLASYATLDDEGHLAIFVPWTATRTLPAGAQAWDLFIQTPTGRSKLIKGQVMIEGAVTR